MRQYSCLPHKPGELPAPLPCSSGLPAFSCQHISILMIDSIIIFSYTDGMPLKSRILQGGTPRMRRLIVSLPEETHKALKVYAAEHYTTIREFVTEAIEQALKKKGGEKGKK